MAPRDRARAIAQRALGRTRQQAVDSTGATNQLNTRMGLLMFLREWRELVRVADSTLQKARSPLAFAVRGVAAAMLGDTVDARRRAAQHAFSRHSATSRPLSRFFGAGWRRRTCGNITTI
jgi:hypothetical protein